MPTYTHTVDVNAPRSHVFAILDDVSRTPEWLPPATKLEKLSDGPNEVGTRLRYHFKQGRGTGQMEGQITARRPDEHLAMLYTDRMMDVAVDFVPAAGSTEGTTRLTHTIDISPRGVSKLFTPFINRSLPKQTKQAMDQLKTIAESEPPAS